MSEQPNISLLVNWLSGFGKTMLEALPELQKSTILLPQNGSQTVLRGLSCTNNDACFSSTYAVGQVMDAVLSGEYTLENFEVIVPNICIDCRANDLEGLLRKALADAGFSQISVKSFSERYLSVSKSGQGTPTGASVKKMAEALLLCDFYEQLLLRLRPMISIDDLKDFAKQSLLQISFAVKRQVEFASAAQFLLSNAMSLMPDSAIQKPLIAFVGTAPSLFNTTINNAAVEQIEAEDCEVSLPWYSDFVLYGLFAKGISLDLLYEIEKSRAELAFLIKTKSAGKFTNMLPPRSLDYYQRLAFESKLVSKHELSGAGWLYVGHLIDLLSAGARHIVYAHSFGCLSAHTVGRGVFRALRAHHPDMSIVSIEYDPGASFVNQSNRLKLLTSQAKESFASNQ